MHLNLQKQFKITFKMQKNKLKKHSNTKKPIMIQNTNQLQFQIGDAVLFSTQNLAIQGPRKLAARFVGPFCVIHRIGP